MLEVRILPAPQLNIYNLMRVTGVGEEFEKVFFGKFNCGGVVGVKPQKIIFPTVVLTYLILDL
jgi:hypothetical protein